MASENRVLYDEGFDWVTEPGRKALLDAMSQAHLNVLVPFVWHGGGVTWDSQIKDPATGNLVQHDPRMYSPDKPQDSADPLADLIREAHARGIQVMPAITVSLRQEDFLNQWWKNSALSLSNIFDIHQQGFRQFIGDMVAELSRNYDIDGLNLDYVRSLGQSKSAVNQTDYKAMTGRDLLADVAQVYSGKPVTPDAAAALEQWNGSAITDIVTRARLALLQNHPGAVLSVSSVPGAEDWKLQGANSIDWANKGLVDVVMNMAGYGRVDSLPLNPMKDALAQFKDPAQMLMIGGDFDRTGQVYSIRPITETMKSVTFARDWNAQDGSNGFGLYQWDPDHGYSTPALTAALAAFSPTTATVSWHHAAHALQVPFTTLNDNVDLNHPAGPYMSGGLIYNALTGDDKVTLPASASAAAAIGYDYHTIFYAGDGNDTVTGGALSDTINGGNGNDTLIGGDGNDVLLGWIGNDTLTGGPGDDRLDGNVGADRMTGGPGNDLYLVENAGDVVTEQPGEGVDSVTSGISYTLPVNVENLTLWGTANLNGTGNALDNVITGNSGNNALTGGAGNDTLDGGAGNDTLIGGLGADRLTGGAGKDTFAFASAAEIGGSKTNPAHDVIVDFTSGQDKIDLSKIDANAVGGTANDAFQFIGSNAFSGVAGQLHSIVDAAHNVTFVEGDLNGDKVADFQLDLSGQHALTSADYLL